MMMIFCKKRFSQNEAPAFQLGPIVGRIYQFNDNYVMFVFFWGGIPAKIRHFNNMEAVGEFADHFFWVIIF